MYNVAAATWTSFLVGTASYASTSKRASSHAGYFSRISLGTTGYHFSISSTWTTLPSHWRPQQAPHYVELLTKKPSSSRELYFAFNDEISSETRPKNDFASGWAETQLMTCNSTVWLYRQNICKFISHLVLVQRSNLLGYKTVLRTGFQKRHYESERKSITGDSYFEKAATLATNFNWAADHTQTF